MFQHLKGKKVAVLVSGGVDSSVSLALLKEAGVQVEGFYLKIWLEDELSYLGDCPWEEDLKYARAVCEELGVPLQVVPLQKEYFAEVVSYTIDEVKKGRTPNPDVMCNSRIKFGMFIKKLEEDYDFIASGHYADLIEIDSKFFLRKSKDSFKDQTYFLANLSQEQLSKVVFPIGKFSKAEVRELAEKYNLANKDRKDSQGICFLGKLKFRDFLKHYLDEKIGDLVEFDSNEKVGEHPGFWYYTIGQRQNIRLSGGPWFVVKKDSAQNIVYVSKNRENLAQVSNEFLVEDLNIVDIDRLKQKGVQVKVRHGEMLYNCEVEFVDGELLKVRLEFPDQAIAKGQFAVFYLDDLCLGCGVIA